MLSDLIRQATFDTLPVLISGVGTQQLLNVLKFNCSTGLEQGKIKIF